MKKKLTSLFLALALCISMITPAFATKSETSFLQKITTVVDSATERLVVAQDGNLLYQAHYDKQNSVFTLRTYQNGNKIYESSIEIDSTTFDSATVLLSNAVVTPIQSKTGFGYVIDDKISSYACSDELVQNGTYPYHAINVYNTSNPTAQASFRNAVDTLISSENAVAKKHSDSQLMSMVAIILACFGQGTLAYAAGAAAIGMEGDAITSTKQLGNLAENCGSYYSMIYPYKI